MQYRCTKGHDLCHTMLPTKECPYCEKVKIRDSLDFYETPEVVTVALLDRENFIGGIWEPACGKKTISNVLENRKYDVYSSERPRKYSFCMVCMGTSL